MRGARTAPRETPSATAAALTLLLFCLFCALAPSAGAATPTAVDIDFSQHGEGQFAQSFFSGVNFTEGAFVGYIQGDQALVGPVAASVKKGYRSIAARIAPAGQGTAVYTLTALGGSGRAIASNSVTVTQDTGDPETGPWGYVSIELGPLPKKASSFRLSNTFVRSSYPHITLIEFGVSSITLLP